jgi:hypothetical protein
LDSALHCFAPQAEYAQQRRDQYSVTFAPPYSGFSPLARIIDKIANNDNIFDENEIYYLRQAFNGMPYFLFRLLIIGICAMDQWALLICLHIIDTIPTYQ